MIPGLLIVAVALAPPKPTEIVFVRHGETVANATGRYNSRTVDTFSARGEKQVAALTRELAPMRFDAILVSPSLRALKTILPYLQAHPAVRAEVWPELYECCDAHTKRIPGLTSPKLRFGRKVTLPAGFQRYFDVVANNNRMIEAPSYEDGLRQIQWTADHLRRRFLHSGQTVLIVGHSLHGGRLLELLEGKAMLGRIRPENAHVMRLQERADGSYATVR
jgi:broad specificity phosphatase PhoE